MARKQVALAKLSRPRLHDVLARTQLYGLLDKGSKRPIVWLCAQPGAGMTTLVASYLETRKRPGIWYQVDSADADPASFIYHLRLAAQTLATGKTPDALPLLTPEYMQDLQGFARRSSAHCSRGSGPMRRWCWTTFRRCPKSPHFTGSWPRAWNKCPKESTSSS